MASGTGQTIQPGGVCNAERRDAGRRQWHRVLDE
jgi:hypothetical protein